MPYQLKECLKKHSSLKNYKNCIFQVLHTLDVIQSMYPTFRHNNLTIDNILTRKEVIDDFNCSNCKLTTSVLKTENVVRVGPIIMFVFKKYMSKYNIDFKEEIIIPYDDKRHHKYILVAQIDQTGTKDGGHYYGYYRRGNKVYLINDSQCIPSNFNINTNTYILIYNYVKTAYNN